jgi:hypothetical protein
VYSSFFPDVEFGLFEKEWRLLGSQVFATIVVLTNERGAVEEDKRYGVDDAEPVARVLANRNRAAAGCPVPEVPTTGAFGGGSGIPLIPIVVGTGGVVIIIGGTRLVWRRKSRTPLPQSNLGDVPDACAGAKQSYEDSRERLGVMREAAHELSEQLRRAEIIHANNIIKANMVVGFEVGSVIGGTVGDLAQAVSRPRGSAPRQQIDTWKPPSKLTGKMAQALQLAQEALDAARSKVKLITDELAVLRTKIDDMVENSPTVRNARDLHTYWSNKLQTAIADLPKATAARKRWAELDELAKKQGRLIAKGAEVRAPIERAAIALGHEVEGLEAMAAKAAAPLKEEVAGFEAAIKKIDDSATMGPGGTKLPLGRDRLAKIARLKELRDEAMERLRDVELDWGRKVGETKRKLDAAKQQLQDLADQPGWKELLADRDRTSAQLQEVVAELNNLDNLSPEDVARYADMEAKAALELVEARGLAKAQEYMDADHMARRLERAKFDELLAQDALDNLRRNIESIEVGATPRIPDGADQGWAIGRLVRWPIRVFGELVFGVGQSPEEIMAILRKGFANIEVLRTGYTALTAEADAELVKATKLRQALDDCIKGTEPAPAAPATPATPAAGSPAR